MRTKPYCDWIVSEWLDFLENRHHQEVQLRLVNAKIVAKRLDLLDLHVPVITVAGTNGKGSTVAALTAIYCAAGYRVGSYTSPHLLSFNERICVNQEPISDAVLCAAFTRIEDARGATSLTYFEAATLAGLLYFKESALDVVILEVGVGGRLDATNIIDSDLAIITTVDFDHQDYLGHDKEAIGYEKAGIMRPGQPCIYADEAPPVSVLSYADVLHTKICCLNVHYSFQVFQDELHMTWNIDKANRNETSTVVVPVPKINRKAAVAAILASKTLSHLLPITQANWVTAMQTVHMLGRQQLVESDVPVLYDVAHNPQAVLLLADFIQRYRPHGVIHAVFSGLKDKDLCGLIRPLSAVVTHWYPALLTSKRAANEPMLREAFEKETGLSPDCFTDPPAAFSAAMQVAKSGDLIVVYGSFLLVSAVMEGKRYETSDN
ncbi:MAG: folylpolyglutamate synthase/dihydrofolate synthase family protein [Legionellaceae bacterium]|nr:folylpolyglutamate synthase/dihydrofolate synthase family protein [Legionellaceae bacterium]